MLGKGIKGDYKSISKGERAYKIMLPVKKAP